MWLTPYLAFAKKSFLDKSAYRVNHLMGILNTSIKIFIFWGIYKALYGGQTEIDGITMTMVTTNFILSQGLEAIFYLDDYYIPKKIWDGSIANELLKPVSIKGRMIAENMGVALFKLIFHFTPAVGIAIWRLGVNRPASFTMFVLFIVSALLGYGILWGISFVLQTTAFWLVNIWSIMTLKNVVINVLSGSMIPLWFMPKWVSDIMSYTPFGSIYFTPVQIYLGQLSYGQIVSKGLIQLAWIVGLYLMGNLLWHKGQKKLVVQGG